jgi:hypothetical protein
MPIDWRRQVIGDHREQHLTVMTSAYSKWMNLEQRFLPNTRGRSNRDVWFILNYLYTETLLRFRRGA